MLKIVRLRLAILISAIFFFAVSADAQLVVNPNAPIPALINQTMLGFGANITNINFTGSNQSIGYFNGINTNLGLDSGIVMSSGRVIDAIGPNTSESVGDDLSLPGDADLNAASGSVTQDAAVLTLDFTAVGDTFSFKFVFGSEEYIEFANQNYNDAFAFLITGPKPGGGNYNNDNIALLPGTTTPVTINNVNNIVNPQYFVSNAAGLTVQYDGFTTVLEATAGVIPDSTYTLKIAIGDVFDGLYDSGVFLQKNCAYEPDSLLIRLVNPIEINCWDSLITLPFNQAFDCNSLAADGTDFILLDSLYNPVSVITGANAASCDSGYGVSFSVDVHITPGSLTWGDYYIVPQIGSDGNSIYSACNQTVTILPDTIPVTLLEPDSLYITDAYINANCHDSVVTVPLSIYIDCNSLASDGTDFVMLDEQFNPIVGAITSASAATCQSGQATLSVDLHLSPGVFNFGTYYILPQIGSDGNTLYSSCDGNLYVASDTLAVIITDPDTLYTLINQPLSMSCLDSIIYVPLNYLADCNSIATDGSDFVLVDSLYNVVQNGINSATSSYCQTGIATDTIRVALSPGSLVFGTYYLITSIGTDTNSIYHICDSSVSITPDTIEINIIEPADLFITSNHDLDISCKDSLITITFNQLIDCQSIAADGSDFGLFTPNSSQIEDVVLGASSIACDTTFGTTTITLQIEPGILNWNTYHLITVDGSDGNSLFSVCSEDITVTTDTITLNVIDYCYELTPDLLNVTVVDDQDIDATWLVPIDPMYGYGWQHVFEAYDVYRAIDPLGPYTVYDTVTQVNDTIYTDFGANVDNEAYSYKVAVRFVDGVSSAQSDSIQSILLTEDTTMAVDTTKLFMTWTDYWAWNNPVYHIWEKYEDNPWALIGTTNSTDYEYDKNITQAGIYKVKVETYENIIDSMPEASSNWLEYETIIYDPVVSNVMTPNGDDKNDNFLIRNLHQHPNTKLSIYNRWGKRVYETEDYQNDWDGGNLKGGTYYYVVEFRGSIPSIQKGHIQLIK